MRLFTHDREQVSIHDNVFVDVWGYQKSGRRFLLDRFSTHNLVVNGGKNLASLRLVGSTDAAVNRLAIGTSTTAVAVTDSALVTEVFRDVLTSAVFSPTGVATFTYFLNTSSANGNTLAEVGLFNAASGPTMFARALLSPTIVKNNTKAVTFTWVTTFA